MVGGDNIGDLNKLKSIIGKKIMGIEFWFFDYAQDQNKWKQAKTQREIRESCANITLILDDGTKVQGVDGEYGTNNIEIINGEQK